MKEIFAAGIGGSNVDLHCLSLKPLILRDSNPGHMYTTAGGVTRNIMENLARMGAGVKLFSAVGGDIFGEYILRACRKAGMDVEHVRLCPGSTSSTYMALVDHEGDMFAAMSDMHILGNITPDWLESKLPVLREAAAVECDPCLPDSALEWITCGKLDGIPLFSDPVSQSYAVRLKKYAAKFFCLKPNAMELETLSGCSIRSDADMEQAAGRLLERGTHRVVVSIGKRGCYWADRDDNRFYSRMKPIENMIDATGAGDAFMAGLLYGYLHNMSPEETARWAMSAGILAVTSQGTVSPRMSGNQIKRIMEEYKL